MKIICKFDPVRDLKETDQFGFVDAGSVIESGSLPVSVLSSDNSYDAVSGQPLAPSQILGVPGDVFDAYEMRDALRNAAARADEAAKQSSATSSSSSEATPAQQ